MYVRATAKMVADRAGVSPTTVSRVLNGKVEAISEMTADRVREAAEALDYRPNSLAVSLRKGSTATIGLIIPDIADAYFHQIARAVEDAARPEGFAVILCNTDREPERELFYLDTLREQQVAGVVFAGGGVNDDEHLRGRDWAGANVVLIGPHNLELPSIGVDNRAASIAAVHHLSEQGCTRIACIGGQPRWAIHQVRLEGLRQGLADIGEELDPELLWLGDFGLESGYDSVDAAMENGREFDGIVAFNDNAALGAIKALRKHGRSIPGDVAVIGFDDLPIATVVEPQLSSISFPRREFGETAARLIIQMARHEDVEAPGLFPFELKARASSLVAGVPA
jgi:LacI family transcriptional regulator